MGGQGIEISQRATASSWRQEALSDPCLQSAGKRVPANGSQTSCSRGLLWGRTAGGPHCGARLARAAGPAACASSSSGKRAPTNGCQASCSRSFLWERTAWVQTVGTALDAGPDSPACMRSGAGCTCKFERGQRGSN